MVDGGGLHGPTLTGASIRPGGLALGQGGLALGISVDLKMK